MLLKVARIFKHEGVWLKPGQFLEMEAEKSAHLRRRGFVVRVPGVLKNKQEVVTFGGPQPIEPPDDLNFEDFSKKPKARKRNVKKNKETL